MVSFPFRRPISRATLTILLPLAGALLSAQPVSAAGMNLVDFGKLGVESQFKVNGSAEVGTQIVEDSTNGKSLEVRCTPGKNPFPGVIVRPGEALNWNLAAYGEIEADVTNISDAPLTVHLRVDTVSDLHGSKSSEEKLALPVGKSGTVRVYFVGAAFDPANVSHLVLYTSKPERNNLTFRITALRAVGKPGDKPAGSGATGTVTKPDADGRLIPFDGSLSATRVDFHGTKLVLPPAGKPGPAIITVQPGANQKPSAVFKVATGTVLDLSGYEQVEFTLKNTGHFTTHVFCRVDNAPGTGGKPVSVIADATLEPDASKTVAVPLAAGSGGFASDKVVSFAVVAEQDGKEKKLELAGIKATTGQPAAAAATPSATPTPTPSASATPSATPTPTPTATPKPSATPAASNAAPPAAPAAAPKATANPSASASPSKPAAASPTPSPSSSPKKSDGPGTTRSV